MAYRTEINKTTVILFVTMQFLLLPNCAKKPETPIYNPGNTDTLQTAASPKKGGCFATNTSIGFWATNLVKLKVSWYYTWGTTVPTQSMPLGAEFVPMFWGKGNVTDDNINIIIQWKNAGLARYVLGFNEPDLSDQANMSVDDAIALWPKLESIGLPIGSPAVAYPSAQWLKDFMQKVKANNRRVDFICIHYYPGTDVQNFVDQMDLLHQAYGLPIWVTEFATADNAATTISANRYSPAHVLDFMQKLVPKLDSLDYIQRYSWFSGSPTNSNLWPSALFDSNANLTALGSWYASFKPNTKIIY